MPLDRVECARCGMLISTETGAAQVVSIGIDTRFYDDVGCLAADWARQPAGATPFVRPDSGWIDARTAFFARSSATRTALGSGLVAYADEADARRADREGRAIGWDEARALTGQAP
ncbi:MAG: hypothetical protein IT176_03610 [Acidobacteria bacterium]|nr:hypothetical protein [Acidobacteriota bacterium]